MPAQKLRIAFATPEFVTETHFDGGLANYLNRVSKKLAELGHDVHVVTHSLENEDEFHHEGVMVHRVMPKRAWHVVNRLTRYSLPTTLHWLNLSAQVYRKLKQLHRHTPFDVIQYPSYSSCGVFAIPLLRSAHIVRGSSYQPVWNDVAGLNGNFDSSLTARLEGLQYRLTRHVHAPSRGLQNMLANKMSVADVRLIRSPFYVETHDWDTTVYDQFLKGKRYALYFGRFQLHKGFHILARALPRFLSECSDACVALVGRDMETSLAPSMAAYARARCGGLAKRLILLDNLPHSQLYPVIAGAHFVVLPSLIDNSPNACLEAMGLGKVVIGTTGTTLDELIADGVNGFLVPPGEPEALANRMISAWSDTSLETMAVAATERMQEFAPENTIASLLSYYSEVRANRHGS
jgi:glycosyltransferase involved in cell wall biosynthesis